MFKRHSDWHYSSGVITPLQIEQYRLPRGYFGGLTVTVALQLEPAAI